jgi:hypothetical protein
MNMKKRSNHEKKSLFDISALAGNLFLNLDTIRKPVSSNDSIFIHV